MAKGSDIIMGLDFADPATDRTTWVLIRPTMGGYVCMDFLSTPPSAEQQVFRQEFMAKFFSTPEATAAGDTRSRDARSAIPARRGPSSP